MEDFFQFFLFTDFKPILEEKLKSEQILATNQILDFWGEIFVLVGELRIEFLKDLLEFFFEILREFFWALSFFECPKSLT